jgi:hypothetical protein
VLRLAEASGALCWAQAAGLRRGNETLDTLCPGILYSLAQAAGLRRGNETLDTLCPGILYSLAQAAGLRRGNETLVGHWDTGTR